MGALVRTLHGKLLPVMACILLVCGCRHTGKTVSPAVVDPVDSMSLREKVSMMFWVRPESLDPDFTWVSNDDLVANGLAELKGTMRAVDVEYPVGGIILFAHNIQNPEQLKAFTDSLRALPGSPLLCIDEEGGRVARIANNPAFGLPHTGTMESLAAKKGAHGVRDAAATIGRYLREYGFDIDFAPVADVNTNPHNIVIGPRAFSSKPEEAATMVKAYLAGLQKAGVLGCVKHFPGHGDTSADTHFGYAVSRKNLSQLRQCELVPFRAGIDAGVRLVMTAHISLPAVTGSDIPSTLSPEVLQGILREEMGFDGVIVTDAMEMGAITKQYSSVEACILAVKAGVDVLLCVKDYRTAVDAIEAAVLAGDIPETRINESVHRIFALK